MNQRYPNVRRRALIMVATVAACFGAESRGDAVPDASELLRRLEVAWRPPGVRLLAKTTTSQRGRPDSEARILVRRSADGRTRIDFLAPEKDSGKALLHADGETWIHLPRTGRSIEVPARRSPIGGGVLFDDLFVLMDSAESATVEARDGAYVLVTTGGVGSTSRASHIYFDPTTLLPVRRDIFSSSGRLMRSVFIEEVRAWQSAYLPWVIRFEDHLRKGTESRVEVLSATLLTRDDAEMIAIDRLSSVPDDNASDDR